MSLREEQRSAASPARRWTLVAVALLGLALVVAPFTFGMFTKGPEGATMMSAFRPFMHAPTLDGYQADLRQIDAGVQQTDGSVNAFLSGGAPDTAAFDAFFPDFASFDHQWPAIDAKMTNLMSQVQGNLGNYQAIAALPSFNLFAWFFVIPGALLALLALGALAFPAWRRGARGALVVVGVGLVVAPIAFQMFSRAPDGTRMMTTFRTMETTQNVEQIQSYFGTMAEGQGAIRLDVVPALERRGLSAAQVATQFPAVATLDANWVHILNDMTPMIGAMSDNVANYQAMRSLPPMTLFPWFFVIPGALVAGLALAAGSGRRRESEAASVPFDAVLEPITVPPLSVREGV